MTDFQVGDRVSVEGVVCEISPEHSANKDAGYVLVKIGSQRGGVFIDPRFVTLVQRPRRKLRVGSVWERTTNGKRFIVLNDEALIELSRSQYSRRDELNLDTEPDLWREVPVEELEREATT